MTEYFKQIVDAWGDRLRSPVLGSVLIFFVATNWQSLFYLFFADKPVRARLLYFDANTDGWSLYVMPVIGGVILAIAVPWISLAGAFLAKFPRAILHEVQSSEALKRRIVEYGLKADEEEAKASLEEVRERRKIDAAKRLNEAEELSSELREEIEEERENDSPSRNLDPTSIEILKFVSKASDGLVFLTSNGISIRNGEGAGSEIAFDSHKEKKMFHNAIYELATEGLLTHKDSSSGGQSYEITFRGYKALAENVD
jgi:hypothetical protein